MPIIAVSWAEWLRRPEVTLFDAPSAVAVEDYCQENLPSDQTAYVFDATDRPLVQAIEAQWQSRYNARQLVDIYNALVGPNKEKHVRKFTSQSHGLVQVAHQITAMTRGTLPYRINGEGVKMVDSDVNTEEQVVEENLDDAAVDDMAAETETKAEARARAKAEKAAAKEAAKAEKAAAREAAKEARKAEKEAAKADKQAAKPNGVIEDLMMLLTDGNKRTVDELYEELALLHPNRGEGMKITVRVQLTRLHKEGKLQIISEDRYDSEGKKMRNKQYSGEPFPHVEEAAE